MNDTDRKLVSIIVPGFNEEAIITKNLGAICEYMQRLQYRFDWELILVDDGSNDKTGLLADAFAEGNPRIKVIHHICNLNLGNALKTGFANVKGQYTITLDLDLSYAPYHIGNLLDTLETTKADVVIASPYMKGGKVTAVPGMRRIMSSSVNRFLRIVSPQKLHTYTGMVRGYRTDFISALNLKTQDYEINTEILYKAMILRARIIEIPAHLDWTDQNRLKKKRASGMRIVKTIFSNLMAGFIFKPYIFFLGAGFILFSLALYLIGWIVYFTIQIYPTIPVDPTAFDDRFSLAVAKVFQLRPHAFYVGGITLILALQVFSLGFLSLQNKRYFEELFHISSSILKQKNRNISESYIESQSTFQEKVHS